MADYGITDKGFQIKRLDTIMENVHAKLSDGFGFNTRLYPKTFLDVLVKTFCGEIAELWEEAQDAYYALQPSTAEGVNLDNAVQFSGITRAKARKTRYKIHCTGDDGTNVVASTIASDTMPQILLDSSKAFTISRSDFHELTVKVVSVAAGDYMITVNGVSYKYTAGSGSVSSDILESLEGELKKTVGIVCKASDEVLTISFEKDYQSGSCELSNNLTTGSVTTIAEYETREYGAIEIPNGIINQIITNTPGLKAVTNRISPTLGRQRETDAELRQSNVEKSAIRSNTTVDSITSHLLSNVLGVLSTKGYENCEDVEDEEGRPPHSLEIIVDGGDDEEIAMAILTKKSGGIRAYGNTVVPVLTEYGDTINIGFSRPEYVFAWIKVVVHGLNLPGNTEQIVRDVIDGRGSSNVGESIYLQEYFGELYQSISGIHYIEIYAGITASAGDECPEYTLNNIIAGYRQKIMVSSDRIEVVKDGS